MQDLGRRGADADSGATHAEQQQEHHRQRECELDDGLAPIAFGDKDGGFRLYRAVGCEHCNQGYKGRVGLHELMLGSDAIKRQIQSRGRVDQILGQALAEGMRTLRQDGIEKVLAGITDMKQVRKVCVR